MHPAMGGQITRNSFYGKASLAGFSVSVTVLDLGLEMGSSLVKRQHGASVRVKDGGVLAARNPLTFKVFSSLWKSRLTFSVTGDRVLLTVKILHSFMILQRKENKTGFLRKAFLLKIANRTDRNSNLINYLAYLLSC